MNVDDRLKEIHGRIRALPTDTHRRVGQALYLGLSSYLEQVRTTWGEQTAGGRALVEQALADCIGRLADLDSLLSADQLPSSGPGSLVKYRPA